MDASVGTFRQIFIGWPTSLRASIRRRGYVKTGQLISHKAWGILSLWRFRQNRMERAFDRRHNVDTAGEITLGALEFAGGNWELGHRYQGIHPEFFRAMIASLPLDYKEFTFIDFGSGKGRAILLASEFPFQKIIGVEFSRTLHECAVRNIKSFKDLEQKCRDIESICLDAALYELPPGPLVLFFYNPFEEQVMEQVLVNIQNALTAEPRPVVLVLLARGLESAVERAGFRRKSAAAAGVAEMAVFEAQVPVLK